jgi:hypothetical protein
MVRAYVDVMTRYDHTYLLAEFRRRIKVTNPVFGRFSLAHHGLAASLLLYE